MNKLLGCAIVLGSFMLSAAPVLGDIGPGPRPGKPLGPLPEEFRNPKQAVPFRVKVSDTAKTAKLIVPANHAKRVLGDGAADGAKESSLQKTRTIFAGLAMSLAVGAFFFISRGANTRHVMTICIALGLASGGATLLWANQAPFPRPVDPPTVLPGVVGEVEIEIVRQGDAVVLVLPKSERREFLQHLREKTRTNKKPAAPDGSSAPPRKPKIDTAPPTDDPFAPSKGEGAADPFGDRD